MKFGLNVGSGQRPFTSTPEVKWTNVDSVSRPGHEPHLVCDGAHLPHHDNSVDYFVLHHVLEHFGCGEAVGLIMEAQRVLKKGGSLVVCVPNMEALARRWLTGEMSTQLYMTNVYGAYMGNEEDRHRWGYDTANLWNFLNVSSIWSSITTFDFRKISGADIAKDWWILGMEAVK